MGSLLGKYGHDMTIASEFWRNRRVFITGHTGFKGSWLALLLSKLGASVTGYALPPPTELNLFELAHVADALHSIEGDVRNIDQLRTALRDARPEVVLHLAAQSLVRLSYSDPLGTFSTNIAGTINLLEACRGVSTLKAIIVVTSDKCYEESTVGHPYKESDPLGGHDPYSASKACAEIITSAYQRSFFGDTSSPIRVASVRAGNVIGGGDWATDRLVPDLICAIHAGKQPLLRNPKATRPWQHVLDPISGYLKLAEGLCMEDTHFAGAWNFGPKPDSTATVETVAENIALLWGASATWAIDPNTQLREAPMLALDSAKAEQYLDWKPQLDLNSTLAWTVSWYRRWHQGTNARELTIEQINRFLDGTQK